MVVSMMSDRTSSKMWFKFVVGKGHIQADIVDRLDFRYNPHFCLVFCSLFWLCNASRLPLLLYLQGWLQIAYC